MPIDTDEIRRALLCALPALTFAGRGAAQDAALVQPQSYKVVLENAQVRVLEFNSRPGLGVCGSGLHSHPAHLGVVLSSGPVRIRTADGKVEEVPAMPVGSVFWSEAVTHATENISGHDLRSLLVEIKHA